MPSNGWLKTAHGLQNLISSAELRTALWGWVSVSLKLPWQCVLQGKQVEAGGDKNGAEEAGQKRRGMEDAALRDVTQFLAQMQDSKVQLCS